MAQYFDCRARRFLSALVMVASTAAFAGPAPDSTEKRHPSATLDQFAKSIAAFGGSDDVVPLQDYALGQVWAICMAGKAEAEMLAPTASAGYRDALATMVGECARLGTKQRAAGLTAKDLTDTAATVIHAEYGAFMQTYRAPLVETKPKDVERKVQARQAVSSMASWTLEKKQ